MSRKLIIYLCERETGEGFSEKKSSQNLGMHVRQIIYAPPNSTVGRCHTVRPNSEIEVGSISHTIRQLRSRG
jgi:hypothetical protein